MSNSVLILFILDEVPNFLVRSQRSDKLAFLVFLFAHFQRIVLLLLFDLLASASHLHRLSLSLLEKVVFDTHAYSFNLKNSLALRSESLEKNEILNVVKNLNVDASESSSTSEPEVFSVLVLLVVVLPDPGTSIVEQFSLVEGNNAGGLDDLRVDLDLLLGLLDWLRGQVELELLFFLFGETEGGALLLLLLLLLDIGSFLVIDVSDEKHGLEDSLLGDNGLHHGLV